MSQTVARSVFLEKFTCLGEACKDTCCKGWGMQLDPVTKQRYEREAPDLLSAVDTGEAEWIMRRDPTTDFCVKFDQGLCGVQKQYGTDFLGDACHFFPRVTRHVGEQVTQTAAMSCPEVARLVLTEANPFAMQSATTDRVPHSIKDYQPATLNAEQTLATHRHFLAAAMGEIGGEASAERKMARISSTARSMVRIDQASWHEAAAFYLKMADTRLPAPEGVLEDPFNLLHALAGLISAAKKSDRPRLHAVVQAIEAALHCTIDWETLRIQPQADSIAAYQAMRARAEKEWSSAMQQPLSRYLAAQLSLNFFPFAGLGETLEERVTILGVRFATVRLALMAVSMPKGRALNTDEVVDVMQPLSRFLDHLADPTFSLAIYRETGWIKEARLRALIGDA